MKSKIIALVLAATTILGTVSANAATRYSYTNSCRGYKQHCNNHHQRPCRPSHGGQASQGTGNGSTTTPPTSGDENVVTPPASGDTNNTTPPVENNNTVDNNNTVVTPPTEDTTQTTPPTEEGNTQVTPPTVEDNTAVTPPTNNEDTVTDNNATQSDKFMVEVEQAIFNKVNEERVKAGVAPLSYNTTMEKYARIKSQDMGDNNYFSHTDLNGNYITSKMQADGVSYKSWGENIAYLGGYGTNPTTLANQFMTNWMNSSGHRKNILSTNFTSMGVGVYKIGNKVYATQEFYR